MSNNNLIDDKVIDNCMEIINAETKPLKKRPSDKAMVCNKIRVATDNLSIARLRKQTPASELEELFKTL